MHRQHAPQNVQHACAGDRTYSASSATTTLDVVICDPSTEVLFTAGANSYCGYDSPALRSYVIYWQDLKMMWESCAW